MFRNLLTKLSAVVLPLTLLVVASGGFQAAVPAFAANTTYYVDCAAGNDSNNGTSTATAWRTIGRASQPTYGAGDQILLKRGCVWTGVSGTPESFVALGSGSVASRITLADYGTGDLPKIDAYAVEAVKLQNVQNWTLRNLDLTHHGQEPEALDTNNEHGKDVTQGSDAFMRPVLLIRGLGSAGVQNCGEPCTVRNVTVDAVRVHDSTWNGVYVVGGLYELDDNTFGYVDNVVIQNSESWANHKAGIEFTGTYTKNITYPTTNVKVLDSYLHHNGGDGIMMGPVNHGLMDGNECSYNGWLRNARLGCWSWDSNDVVIQFSESHHNDDPLHTSKSRDGGGFDLDLGTEDSVMQYNWSHDNTGEGYLLMGWPVGFGYSRGATHNAQLRYSLTERDAKGHGASIFMFGDNSPSWVYNNTVYYEPDRLAGSTMYQAEGAAIGFSKWGKSGTPTVNVYNNIFIVNGTVNTNAVSNLARDEAPCVCTINRNVWYRVEGGVRYDWNGSIITTFAGWQAKGYDANGVNANPQINGTLGAGPSAYQLKSSSPAIGIAQTVASPRGMGSQDYFGDTTPNGGTYDAGFDEYTGTFSSINSHATPAAHYVPGLTTVHNSDIWTTNSSGTPLSVFSKNGTVYWKVKMVNGSGTGIAGITVKTRVFKGVWNEYLTTTSFSAVTDANGIANFSGSAGSSVGQNRIIVTGVSTPASYYYDSAQNADFIQAYTVQ